MAKTEKEKLQVLTPTFRVSYPHLFKPQAMGNSDPKYSITMLFKKSEDLSAIKLAIKHAKIDAFGADSANWPRDIKSPVSDGDEPDRKSGKVKEGYEDCWVIKATSSADIKPGVVGRNEKVPIEDPAEIYAGCYARAQVFARVWEWPENSKNYGVQFILDHVQKVRDGKSLASRKGASEVFSPLTGDDGSDGEESGNEPKGFM